MGNICLIISSYNVNLSVANPKLATKIGNELNWALDGRINK